MNIDLRYGRGTLPLTLPKEADATVIRKPFMPIIDDPHAAVISALENPVNGRALSEIAKQGCRVCIAICDITRPVPNHLFLRPIIEMLLDAGVAAVDITVLVATGLHRPNEGDELAELVGDPWVPANVAVENHFARRDVDHVDLGKTSKRGTVIRLDRRFVEADIRIATGLVEPHFMAGYSGGRKVIAPGLAHMETITTFHSARFMADPRAANCNLDGNPLHEEQLEIVDMLGGAWALNTVIDADRNLSFVNFGEVLASHQQAVDFVREFCEVPVPRRFNTVVTSAAGYPLDKTYYQTVKGMVGAMEVLKPGGDLIIASECSEGLGSPEFVAAQRRMIQAGPDAFLLSILQKSHAAIDEWQTQMQLKPLAIGNLHLYTTGLDGEDHEVTGVNVVSSLDDAVRASLSRSDDKAVAVVPEGPYVVPFYQSPAAKRG
jgi:nickel-dependent lactate racemase